MEEDEKNVGNSAMGGGKLRLDELLDGKGQFETKGMETEALPAGLQVKESLSGPQFSRLQNGITVSPRVCP